MLFTVNTLQNRNSLQETKNFFTQAKGTARSADGPRLIG